MMRSLLSLVALAFLVTVQPTAAAQATGKTSARAANKPTTTGTVNGVALSVAITPAVDATMAMARKPSVN